MRTFTSALFAIVALDLLAGCSVNVARTDPSAPLAGLQGRVPPPTSHLYVANQLNSTITVYDPSTGAYVRKIHTGLSDPDWIAFDTGGDLFVSNATGNHGVGDVTIYASGQSTPYLTLKKDISSPTAVAVAPGNFAYVTNAGNNSVTVYVQGTNMLDQQLGTGQGIENPQALLIDPGTGNLYVANGATSSNQGSVTVYTGMVGRQMLATTITTGIDNPRALAFDSASNLYVANDTNPGSITVYPSNYKSGDPSLTIPNVASPNALALGPGGLYVASGSSNQIEIYQPGTGILTFTISNGVENPASLAFGPNGYLSVANDVAPGNVTQYCGSASCTSPSRTISKRMDGPASIAFGP